MQAVDIALIAGAIIAVGSADASPLKHRNVTAGGELRAGVYGRIELGRAAPPAVIFPRAVTAAQALGPASTRPVYLYVPPGQVRKWEQHCAKWQACNTPVLFVRMDDSPSRLGSWSRLKESAANRDDG